jgi:predicted Zn-dependent protease
VDVTRNVLAEAESMPAGASRSQQANTLYAAALASAKLRDSAAAAKFAATLAAVTAGEAKAARIATLLSAELALQAGDPKPAAALGASASSGRPELMLSSAGLIATGRAGETAQRLQTWVSLHPRDGEAWQLLAKAYLAQGQTLRGIRAEAEAHVAHLDYDAAMDRFRAAQDLARKGTTREDHIEASIIDTRTREVASLLREQAAER